MLRPAFAFVALFLVWTGWGVAAQACEGAGAVCSGRGSASAFPLIVEGRPAVVRTDPGDHLGLLRAAADLRLDLERVSGQPSSLRHADGEGMAIIVGTLGRNADIDAMAASGRLDVSGVAGEWEGFVQQVIDNPVPGVERALVIAGSDMRGAIFGVYDLSERMGVSPWHWWADVPTPRQTDLHVLPGRRADRPHVRYRGIFLNDENPALYGWVNHSFGGFNQHFYTRVFELILRLKGNYLWPAMWGKAFSDDDPMNAVLANEWGVVIGTSHHEPMTRAHVEWERYGSGSWDYTANTEALRRFWREGIERMGDHESVVTVGMRGDGDEAMTEGTATALLETIVTDQRAIIADVTGRDASETRQVWALYKEVQDYYDAGMQVPDDVMLLFADDNWGNIRRLPEPGSARPGGYGVYYHFDYVGGPRNYKWLNTTQVERTWEQMNLAHAYGATELWIVNVGDLKPMELPISAFLTQAWNPEAMTLEAMGRFTRNWAARQFGETQADEIAELLTRYTQYNARRKPELIGPDTFSLIHFGDADRVLDEWADLAARADAVRAVLAPQYDDAFVQLVWFPIHASGNLTRLHVQTGRNRLHAAQGRVGADALAAEVEALFDRDAELARIYHEDVADGKWPHMMSQTHISYTFWQQPDVDVLPELARVTPVPGAALGVAVEGDARAFTGGLAALPPLHRHGQAERWIELFDRGDAPVRYTLEPGAPWLRLSQAAGAVDGTTRVAVSVDWPQAPGGEASAPLIVRGSDGSEITVRVTAVNPPEEIEPGRFIEADGHVTVEAEHFARAIGGDGAQWRVISELGRTLSGVTAFPVVAPAREPGGDGPRLEYDVHLAEAGEIEVRLVLSPTLDFRGQGGLRYAVSIDDGPLQVVNIHADGSEATWERHVADAVAVHATRHRIETAGPHTVKVWLVDPGLVIQRVILAREGLAPSYLGPPESRRAP